MVIHKSLINREYPAPTNFTWGDWSPLLAPIKTLVIRWRVKFLYPNELVLCTSSMLSHWRAVRPKIGKCCDTKDNAQKKDVDVHTDAAYIHTPSYERMDGWMDRCIDGWVNIRWNVFVYACTIVSISTSQHKYSNVESQSFAIKRQIHLWTHTYKFWNGTVRYVALTAQWLLNVCFALCLEYGW